MDSRRQQQFPPLLQTQAGGHPPRQHLPLSPGPSPPLSGHKRNNMALDNRPSDGANVAKLFVGSLPLNISEEEEDKQEKEHVLLEFEDGWLPNSNTRFSLSGLDTMNPTLVLEDGTKMVVRLSLGRTFL